MLLADAHKHLEKCFKHRCAYTYMYEIENASQCATENLYTNIKLKIYKLEL